MELIFIRVHSQNRILDACENDHLFWVLLLHFMDKLCSNGTYMIIRPAKIRNPITPWLRTKNFASHKITEYQNFYWRHIGIHALNPSSIYFDFILANLREGTSWTMHWSN